jgi:cell migration-inducing and hyaluronan-binding protein
MSAVLAFLIMLSVIPASGPLGRHERADSPQPWSDPATWGGSVPREGDVVEIRVGKTVLLDVSPPWLAGLEIKGGLVFDERDLLLRTEWIVIRGRLQIGEEDRPFRNRATIALLDRVPGENVLGYDDRVIAVVGGALDLHGEVLGPTWTRLAATAKAGADALDLERPVLWRPGDRIVVASTDFDQYQAEERTVRAVDGTRVRLDAPLAHGHWGEDQTYGDEILSERAEVGLLTRNIQVTADPSAERDGIGGHLIVVGGEARIEGAEFTRMGQRGKLARYPIHFHMVGDAPTSYVRFSSIHHTFNRCLTVHGTNRVRVEWNVAYDAVGHCYFLEDGAETGNVFGGNLGLLTRAPAADDALLPSDLTPATFWITNPDNVLRGNAAAGSDAFGFWYALPEHPTGHSESAANDAGVWPRRTPLGEFSGNVADSNGFRGLNVDNGPRPDGTAEEFDYTPRRDPIPSATDAESPPEVATFEDLTAYKNRERGVWLRGSHLRLVGARLADNAIGATIPADQSFVEDTLFVGESANVGEPGYMMPSGRDGRSLPLPWMEDFPIRGQEFYPAVAVGVSSVAFAGFVRDEQRPASGIGFVTPSPFAFNPGNYVEDASWLDESNRVWIAEPTPMFDGDQSAVFQDRDGSVSGRAGAAVVAEVPFLQDGSCRARNDWQAAVCDAHFGFVVLVDLAPSEEGIGPVTLAREDGTDLVLAGSPDEEDYDRPSIYFSANLVPEQTYAVSFAGESPIRLRVAYYEPFNTDDGVVLRLPWTGVAPFVYFSDLYEPQKALTEAASLDDLVSGDDPGFYASAGYVYLKLAPLPMYGAVFLDLCRQPGCT